ncbi:hypothetical protein [Vibrio rotiferianus]|uniref:hypothetical protein n=1 Tax=Vibrio rotiferianus TaxID=190895 RepID=UPI00397EB095
MHTEPLIVLTKVGEVPYLTLSIEADFVGSSPCHLFLHPLLNFFQPYIGIDWMTVASFVICAQGNVA